MHPVCSNKDVVEAIFSSGSLSQWSLLLQTWFHVGIASLPTILCFLIPWDTSMGWDYWMTVCSVDCCSVCKNDKATEKTTFGCVASFFFFLKEQLGHGLKCICFSFIVCRELSCWNGLLGCCPLVKRDVDSSTSIPGTLLLSRLCMHAIASSALVGRLAPWSQGFAQEVKGLSFPFCFCLWSLGWIPGML